MSTTEGDDDIQWENKVLSIVPRITGCLSCLCSMYIVQQVLRSSRRREKTYHRLLLGMSLNDVMSSFFGHVLGMAPMPSGSAYSAIGTEASCSVIGFIVQGAYLTSPLYNGTLTTFYLLMIAKGWKEGEILKVEWILHTIPFLVGWGTAIAGAVLNIYGPANFICWIGGEYDIYRLVLMYIPLWVATLYVTFGMIYIYYCVRENERMTTSYREPEKKLLRSIRSSAASSVKPPGDESTTVKHNRNNSLETSDARGEMAHNKTAPVTVEDIINRRSLLSSPESTSYPSMYRHPSQETVTTNASTTIPSSTGRSTMQQQRISRRHALAMKSSSGRKLKSRLVANRAMSYVGAMYVTFCFGTITRFLQGTQNKTYFPLILLTSIFGSLQGFFNYLVYTRKHVRKLFKALSTCCTFTLKVPTSRDRQEFQSNDVSDENSEPEGPSTCFRQSASSVVQKANKAFGKLLRSPKGMSQTSDIVSKNNNMENQHGVTSSHGKLLDTTDHTILNNSVTATTSRDNVVIIIEIERDEVENTT